MTDANLVLGRLAPDYFLGGQMSLDLERARGVMARLGVALGLDAVHTALGVVEVVNAHMERALRVISVERGHDPRLFTLLSFGGAGGLHAVDLARRLGIRSILVPPLASTLSALGMLSADVVRDASQTVMLPGNTSQEEIAARLTGLIERVRPGFGQNGFPSGENDAPVEVIETFVDMRYVGQSYELTVAFGPDLQADFHEAHQRAYGYSRPQAQTELVNLRARLTHKTPPPVLPELQNGGTDPIRAHLGRRPVALGRAGRFEPVDFYRWEALRPGNQIQAPAVVIRNDTTIFLERADQVWVDVQGNLWIQVGE